MKKNFKLVLALVLSLMMVLGSVAMAAGLEGPDGFENAGAPFAGDTHWDTTWAGVADNAISVGGLATGDTVKFYKVLEYDDSADKLVAEAAALTSGGADYAAQGWKVASKFTSGNGQVTLDDFKAILTTGITAEMAGRIAKNATGTATFEVTVKDADNGVATKTAPGAGLYVAIVVPAATGVLYNPIFVASDYYNSGSDPDKSSTWTPVTTPLSYADKAMAKKAELTITKTATENAEANNEKLPAANATNDAKGVGVGDKIDYTITSTIPEFADNYISPKFIITDTMVGGLDLVDGTIKVYVDDSTTELASEGHFTLTPAPDKHSYTIDFTPAYLLTLDHNTPVKVTYQALVTEDAVTNVHEEDNTVELEYSHEPEVTHDGDKKGKKVKDKTHHYTWTIDGNIWGDESWRTIESVKVGLDKEGNEIKEEKVIQNGHKIGALQDAEFALYVDEACTTEYAKGLYGETTAPKIKSDANGYLNIVGSTGISGLDAGTYWLKETKAPDGYIKQQEAVKIEIIPTYYGEVSWVDSDGCTITCDDLLKSYIVKIDGVQTAEYTINYEMNEAGTLPKNDSTIKDGKNNMTTHGEQGTNTIVIGNAGPIKFTDNGDQKANEEAGKIKNTQGVELPSTGGVGTTIFYVAGSIMVLAAAILLITKRRMGVND